MTQSRYRRRYTSMPSGSNLIGITDMRLGSGVYQAPSYTYKTYPGSYATEDSCVDRTNPGPPYRTGGNVLIYSYAANASDVRADGTYVSYIGTPVGLNYRYRGGFIPNLSLGDVISGFSNAIAHSESLNPGTTFPSRANASAYGATGWSRFRPGNPSAGLGVFIGEIKDVPRMLQTSARGFASLWRSMGGSRTKFGPKSVANHWLNTQFGWLPFLSDLRRFHKTYTRMDAILSRIRAENGHWVKRKGTVESSEAHTTVRSNPTVTGHWPTLVTALYNSSSSGSHSVTRQDVSRVWFEGTFRYWIPSIDSVQWRTRTIAEIYGALPCPSLVWELTPWSWLADWGTNAGDVISNLSTNWAENLAAKYAFIMKHSRVEATLESWCNLKSRILHDSWTFHGEWKTRTGASPFGFGLTDADFSARQWSILSALGITHARGSG